MEQRDYQLSDGLKIREALKDSKRVIYQLPTGGGKTVVASKIIEEYKTKNVLILVHKRKLITQMKDNLLLLDIEVGIMQGQNLLDLKNNIIIASVQTAVKDHRIDYLLERVWDLVIVDEARRTRTASYDKVLDALKENNSELLLLGLDATPNRRDRKPLDYHFNEMVVSSENTYSLIKKGYLCDTITYATPIGDIEEAVTSWGGDFQISQLSSYMRQSVYLSYILESWFTYAQEKQTIVFAVDKEHAQEIYELFLDNGIESVAMMHSDFSDEQVDNMFDLYEKGEIQILINIEMITEGVDLPNTECLLIARPTQSLTLYLQILGRGLRKKKNGSKLTVIDCAGVTEKFGGVKTSHHWSLNPEIKANGVKKMRIFGKREDDTYVQDISNWKGELVELSPEEYISQIASGKEVAIEINNEIDSRISDIGVQIEEYIYSILKGNSFLEDVFVSTDIKIFTKSYLPSTLKIEIAIKSCLNVQKMLSKNDVNIHNMFYSIKSTTINIYLEEPRLIVASINNSYHNSKHCIQDHPDNKDSMILSYIAGMINYQIMSNSQISNTLYSFINEIKLLLSEKVSIRFIEDIERKIKEEQFIQDAREASRCGESFYFHKRVSGKNHFKGFYKPIDSIRIEGSIKKHNNTIYINGSSLEDDIKKFIKEEKIIEILKAGEWKSN